jgi:hypothetical protein
MEGEEEEAEKQQVYENMKHFSEKLNKREQAKQVDGGQLMFSPQSILHKR